MLDAKEWNSVEEVVESVSGKRPENVNAVLFLIGVQELGKGFQHFSKEEKQDLLHIATCKVFSLGGYYRFTHIDDDGWPHYELTEKLPHRKLLQQEELIKEYIVQYFRTEELIK